MIRRVREGKRGGEGRKEWGEMKGETWRYGDHISRSVGARGDWNGRWVAVGSRKEDNRSMLNARQREPDCRSQE